MCLYIVSVDIDMNYKQSFLCMVLIYMHFNYQGFS